MSLTTIRAGRTSSAPTCLVPVGGNGVPGKTRKEGPPMSRQKALERELAKIVAYRKRNGPESLVNVVPKPESPKPRRSRGRKPRSRRL